MDICAQDKYLSDVVEKEDIKYFETTNLSKSIKVLLIQYNLIFTVFRKIKANVVLKACQQKVQAVFKLIEVI